VLLLHLLQWKHQPHLCGSSRRASIANARDEYQPAMTLPHIGQDKEGVLF